MVEDRLYRFTGCAGLGQPPRLQEEVLDDKGDVYETERRLVARNPSPDVVRRYALLTASDAGRVGSPLAPKVVEWTLRHRSSHHLDDGHVVIAESERDTPAADLALHPCLPSSARQRQDTPHNGCRRAPADNVGAHERVGPACPRDPNRGAAPVRPKRLALGAPSPALHSWRLSHVGADSECGTLTHMGEARDRAVSDGRRIPDMPMADVDLEVMSLLNCRIAGAEHGRRTWMLFPVAGRGQP